MINYNITNNYDTHGAGIFLRRGMDEYVDGSTVWVNGEPANLTVINSNISNNVTQGAVSGAPGVSNNPTGNGGGFYIVNGTANILKSTINGNTGGAFRIKSGDVTVENCTIANNLQGITYNTSFNDYQADDTGGFYITPSHYIMTLGASNVKITNCTILNNHAFLVALMFRL